MIAICPHCENSFYCAGELAGQIVRCSRCNKSVKTPERRIAINNDDAKAIPAIDLSPASMPTPPDPHSKTAAKKGRKPVNFRNGFRRLTLVLSLLPLPAVLVASIKIDYILYTLKYPFLAEPLSLSLGHIVFFIALWVAYGLALFVARGFYSTKVKQKVRKKQPQENKQPEKTVHKQPKEDIPRKHWRSA